MRRESCMLVVYLVANTAYGHVAFPCLAAYHTCLCNLRHVRFVC